MAVVSGNAGGDAIAACAAGLVLERLARPLRRHGTRRRNLGLLYEPPRASDLSVETVAVMQLELVATEPGLTADDSLAGYVHVDWGTPYAMTLSRTLPELPEPVLRVDAPEVAYEFLRSRGGAAYLPLPAVGADVAGGRLHAVAGAPRIERPVYLIQSADARASATRAAVYDHLVAWLGRRADAA